MTALPSELSPPVTARRSPTGNIRLRGVPVWRAILAEPDQRLDHQLAGRRFLAVEVQGDPMPLAISAALASATASVAFPGTWPRTIHAVTGMVLTILLTWLLRGSISDGWRSRAMRHRLRVLIPRSAYSPGRTPP